jgi:hypothetical protein
LFVCLFLFSTIRLTSSHGGLMHSSVCSFTASACLWLRHELETSHLRCYVMVQIHFYSVKWLNFPFFHSLYFRNTQSLTFLGSVLHIHDWIPKEGDWFYPFRIAIVFQLAITRPL